MAAAATHPLDLTKVRLQTHSSAPSAHPPSTYSVIRATVRDNGLRSLYTGLSASILRQMTYSLVRIGVYEDLKSRISNPSSVKLLVLAAFTGGLGGIVGNPAGTFVSYPSCLSPMPTIPSDILLVRMTTDPVRPVNDRYSYGNALRGLAILVREEGIRGLTRGLEANTVRYSS
jgi:solute carrier family 25 (mitochondrial dicarboxylate transporter), member 10